MADKKIQFQVGYTLDKTSLNAILQSLQELQKMTASDLLNLDDSLNIAQARAHVRELNGDIAVLKRALTDSFNSDLGVLNLERFNQQLKTIDMNRLAQDFNRFGATGQIAFRNLTTQILTTNGQLKQSYQWLDKMSETMANTVRWSITSNALNAVIGKVQQAYGYAKSLDSSLNDIRIVTSKSADEMERFAQSANKAAQNLGAGTKDYTKASLIYYQQGLSEEDVNARAETTLKAANVTGQSTKAVSEQLTAVWNGYKVSAEEAELYVDKLAAVAATTASDLEELSIGMSKVASAANSMGVDVDQLNAMLSTIIAVTRQAPENAGTSLKTIFSRMEDLKISGEDEYGVKLGEVSATLAEMGVYILDAQGQLRDLGEVIEEVGNKWNNGAWSQAERQALAIELAGKRQYNNLIALFDNWDMYNQAVKTSIGASGTLQKQQDIYMEQTAAHLQQLETQWEDLYSTILDPKFVNGFADISKTLLKGITDLTKAIGGGGNALLSLGSIATQVFSRNIAQGIAKVYSNIQAGRQENINEKSKQDVLNLLQQSAKTTNPQLLEDLARIKQMSYDYDTVLDEEGQTFINELIKRRNEAGNKKLVWDENVRKAVDYLNGLRGMGTDYDEVTVIDSADADAYERAFDERRRILERQLDVIASTEQSAEKLEKAREKSRLGPKKKKSVKRESAEFYESLFGEKTGGGIRNSLNTMLGVLGTSGFDDETKNAYAEEINEINAMLDTFKAGGVKDVADFSSQVTTRYKKLIKDMISEQKRIEGIVHQSVEGVGDGIVTSLETTDKAVEAFREKLEFTKQVQSLTSVISAFGQLASGILTCYNIVKIWGDETISIGDKVTQTILGIAQALPMVISSISTIVVNWKGMVAAIAKLGPLIVEFLPIIAAVAAAIALIVVTIQEVYKATHEAELAAAAAKEQADLLAESYQKAAAESQNLAKTFEQYQSAIDKTNSLAEGTKEYSEQLEEANARARELIKTYKILKDDYHVENGLITFNDGVIEKIQQEQKAKEQEAQKASLIAEGISNQADYDVELKNFKKAVREQSYLDLVGLTNGTIENYIRLASDDPAFLADNDSFKEVFKLDFSTDKEVEELRKQFEQIVEAYKSFEATNDVILLQLKENILKDLSQEEIDEIAGDNAGLAQTILSAAVTTATNTLDQILAQAEAESQKASQNTILEPHELEELAKDYAKLVLGRDDLTYSRGGWGGQYLKDKNGKDVYSFNDTDYAKIGIMQQQVTYQKYLNDHQSEAEDEVNQYLAIAEKIKTKAGGAVSDIFAEDIIKGAATTNAMDFSNLFSILDPDQVKELVNMSESEVLDFLGLTEDDVKNLGYKSAKGFFLAFNNGFVGYTVDWNNLLESAMSRYDDQIAQMGLTKKKTAEYKDEILDLGEYMMRTAEQVDEFADSLKHDANSAVIAAKSIISMNRAIDTLADNMETWSDVLKNSDDSSEEYADATMGIVKALGELYGLDDDYIALDTVKNHLEDIEKIATGDEDAIERLREVLTDDIEAKVVAKDGLTPENIGNITSWIDQLQEKVPNLEIGAMFEAGDDSKIVDLMNNIIETAQLTADEANALFSSIGFEPTFVTELRDVNQIVPNYKTATEESGEYTYVSAGLTNIMSDGTGDEILKQIPIYRTYTWQDGVTPVTGKVEVSALSSDGEPPKINSVTRKATGANSNYSKMNAGGGAPGKKSSKSGSKAKKEKGLKFKDEVDRYHDINLEIKKLATQFEVLGKQQEKLTGKNLIDNLNKQLDILKLQQEAYKTKISLEKGEQEEIRKILAAQGVTFDEEGYISNYADIMVAKMNIVNDAINAYSAMSSDEQDAYKDTLDNTKEDYEDFKKYLERYDTIISEEIPELNSQIQEAFNKEIELNVKKFTMEVDIRINMASLERDYNAFRKKVIEGIRDDKLFPEDILGTAKSQIKDYLSYFDTYDTGTGSIQAVTKQIEDTIAEIERIDASGMADYYKDDKKKALEDLEKYYNQLRQDMIDIVDLTNSIKHSYLEMIDKTSEAFERQVNRYKYATELMEHNKTVIGLLYGDDAYDEMAEYYQQIEDNNNQQIDFLKKRADYAREMLDAETDPEAKLKWEEEWKNAVSELNATVESQIQNIIDKYVNAIDQIFDKLNKKLSDEKGLQYIGDELSLLTRNADEYLDKINELYAIDKLQDKYRQAIDKTDNLSIQKRLNDLMNEQVKLLQEKDKLTQYDVDRANMRYEIALKQIALEEAQLNKTTLRLRRDSQGNYRYEYVADEDKIAQAEDELETAKNELYNFDKQHYRENLDQIYDIYNEFQEKLKALYEDQTLTAQERQEREALLVEQYGELINAKVEQNTTLRENLYESAFEELAALMEQDVENFTNMSQAEQDELMTNLIPQWDSGVQHMADIFAGEGGFIPVCQEAFEALNETTNDYQNSLAELESVAGQTFEQMASGYDENIDKAKELIDVNDDLINKYRDEVSAILDVISELERLSAEYDNVRKSAEAATTAAYNMLQAQNAAAAAAAANEKASGSGYGVSNSVTNKVSTGTSNSSGSNLESDLKKGADTTDRKTSVSNNQPYSAMVETRMGILHLGGTWDQMMSQVIQANGAYDTTNISIINTKTGQRQTKTLNTNSAHGYATMREWLLQMQQFDTGGYTGSWGSTGKLATLHEKELVLNQEDTRNILSAVSVVRSMTDSLASLNQSMNSRMTQSALFASAAPAQLDQNVHIEASFPAVTNSREIEEAFNNLVNIASMRAFNNQL